MTGVRREAVVARNLACTRPGEGPAGAAGKCRRATTHTRGRVAEMAKKRQTRARRLKINTQRGGGQFCNLKRAPPGAFINSMRRQLRRHNRVIARRNASTNA
jgi:hypothetical protein